MKALYDGIIAEMNRDLASFEQLKKVILVDEEFSAATGTLTHTLKLRRRGIELRFKEKIEAVYEAAESQAVT